MSHAFRDLSPVQSYFCDVLRYIAALAVALHHVLGHLDIEWYYQLSRARNANLGALGVAIFFILSGFLITHTIARKSVFGTYDFRSYFVERLTRIYLVFIPALIFAALTIIMFKGGLGGEVDSTISRLFLNLIMFQGVHPFSQHGETFALLGPSWTLSYEFWFYALYGLAVLPIFFGQTSGFLKGVALFLVASIALNMEHFSELATYWLSGAAAAALFQTRFRPSGVLAIVLAIISLLLLIFVVRLFDLEYRHEAYLMTGAVTFLLFITLNSIEAIKSFSMTQQQVRLSIAHRAAAFSYSLYITHIIFLFIAFELARPVIDSLSIFTGNAVATIVLLIYVNIGAWAFSFVSERHNNKVRNFLLSKVGRKLSPLALKWWRKT